MTSRRALLTTIAAAAAAASFAPLPAFAVGALVDVQIVDRDRNDTLPTYRHRGASYVAGKPGDRYAVRLSNRSGGRVLVVLSIDGVNAVSGETAATGQTGYVLAPWQTTEITGWRKSYAEAAAFYFTALPDSYAARTDRPDNVGVIGAAVFRERSAAIADAWRERSMAPPASPPLGRAAAPQAAPSADARNEARAEPRAESDGLARKAEKLGTGHGEREYSPVQQTAFERASTQPAEVVQLRYDSSANLVAAGVIGRPRPWPRVPEPFPSFVADPG